MQAVGRSWDLSAASLPSAEPLKDAEEDRWVERAQSGDEAAYRWLLQRYRERVVRLAAHVLRRSDEAEDVTQEAFLRAFRNLRSYRRESRFYAWLYAIVVRICLDRRRLARWKEEQPSAPPGSGEEPALSFPAEAVDTRVLVEALLDRLSPPIRAALVLRELEGLEYEEIARVLEVPVGTVRSRLNAARSQFRELWRAALEEDHV